MKLSARWFSGIQFLLLLTMVAGVLGFRFEVLSFSGLGLIFASTLGALLLVAVVGFLVLPIAWIKGQGRLAAHAVLSVILGILPLVTIIAMVGAEGFSLPRIHDISTDTQTPPVFVAAVNERTSSENSLDYGGAELAAQQLQAYPDIVPYQSALMAEQTFDHALTAVQKLGWRIIREDRVGGVIEAVEETRVFGFKDDVIIRITPLTNGCRVDMRSVSRVGVSDLGANAARILRFFNELDMLLATSN